MYGSPMVGGFYDNDGNWHKTKFCFVSCCENSCNCRPPNDLYYNKIYDKRLSEVKEENAENR